MVTSESADQCGGGAGQGRQVFVGMWLPDAKCCSLRGGAESSMPTMKQ